MRQFTKKEEKLLVIFLALHQYENKILATFENYYHPIVSKITAESKRINVPKELERIGDEKFCYRGLANTINSIKADKNML